MLENALDVFALQWSNIMDVEMGLEGTDFDPF